MMNQKMTVGELVHYLKMKIDQDLKIQNILVQGEISNFTLHRSQHLYFTLKDEQSRLQCVMFASNASRLKFKPKEGDKVIVTCSTSVFEASGQLQLVIRSIQLDGLGELYLELNALKKRLFEAGYFNVEHKKAFNAYPMKIAMITGDQSAAYNDMTKTLQMRWPLASHQLFATLVQGQLASAKIKETLEYVDTLGFDAIIIARGGGSIEDLWAFNDEALALSIFKAKTPIICGVGHETDVTIAEMVADLRASTPTQAVMMITPDYLELRQQINQSIKKMVNLTHDKVARLRGEYHHLMSSVVFENTDFILMDPTLRLEYLTKRLLNSQVWLDQYQRAIMDKRVKLTELIKQQHRNQQQHLARSLDLLDAYSPLKILKRGYSLTYHHQLLVNQVSQLKQEDLLTIKMQDGVIKAHVKEIIHD